MKELNIIPRLRFARLTLLLICSRNFSLLSTFRFDLFNCSFALIFAISYLTSDSRFLIVVTYLNVEKTFAIVQPTYLPVYLAFGVFLIAFNCGIQFCVVTKQFYLFGYNTRKIVYIDEEENSS